MIAVIADDFTGAAELAGIGLRYDLKVELAMSAISTDADLLVVSADSRSLNSRMAHKTITKIVKDTLALQPSFIYKKIDSVFRGHVLDEIKIQMQESGLKKALIVGGNPSLGRTIIDGKYYLNGDLISGTDFGNDPEFAITDSSVLKIIKATSGEAIVLKHTDELPGSGIVIANVESEEDMKAWANKVDTNCLLAGAGDFFTALLEKNYKAKAIKLSAASSPHLYVSGTAYNKSQQFVKEIKHKLGCVAYLSAEMMKTGEIDDGPWFKNITEMLSRHKKAVIAINDEDVDPWYVSAVHLRNTMAEVVKRVLEECEVKEIYIEGGSTAAAILRELGIEKLSVVNELQRGVVRTKAGNLFITVKPGSYPLPEEIKRLYTIDK
jgi:D-threonate/D-erythronate kinase